ncbi:hypothetical protein CsSME_00024991 [Camellia sinensis var. sinensis]
MALERNGSSFSDKSNGGGTMRQPLLVKSRTNNTSQIAIVGANTCPIESLDYEFLVLFLELLLVLSWARKDPWYTLALA